MTEKPVFISYARTDEKIMKQIVTILQSCNIRAWYDIDGIQMGDDWWRAIVQAIDASDVVILLLSRTSMASIPCQQERDYAFNRNKRIIPIRVDDQLVIEELPHNIQSLNIRTYEGDPTSLAGICDAIIGQKRTRPIIPTIIGLIMIAVVALIGMTILLNQQPSNDNGENVLTSSTATIMTDTGQQTSVPDDDAPTSAVINEANNQPIEGMGNFSLYFENEASLTLKANMPSTLSRLSIVSGQGSLTPSALFTVFDATVVPEGSCLRIFVAPLETPPPSECEPAQTFTHAISTSDAIWYNNFSRQLETLIIEYDGQQVMICSPASLICSVEYSAQ